MDQTIVHLAVADNLVRWPQWKHEAAFQSRIVDGDKWGI